MFVRLESGVIINVERINHMEPANPALIEDQRRRYELAPQYYHKPIAGKCWFYKGVGESLTEDDWSRVISAIEKGSGLL